ncbi:MAG: isoleucine--tRNA ligase [Deltaproteobacteria bacterium]|nr:isoleucine--tRNA ligase [Deltaproteobacteria bacterium]
MDYKKTLNLPVTKFRMKANLVKHEPEQLKSWEESGLYDKLRKTSHDKEQFILHDGPPYANGNIHIGTALNKILKDIIIRTKQMQGFDAVYVPGWDCHGLPIEHNVEKELGNKKKDMSQKDIRKLCRSYAEKYIDIQREEFKRLGVMGEWDNPYLTMNYRYEAIIAAECGKFALGGGLFRSKKPILWCCSCKTALAEAEIEYEDATSPSIYVKFPVKDDLSTSIPDISAKNVFVVIWTTTPWTLPANLAVCLHPEFIYAAVDTGNDEILIIARELVETCMDTFGFSDYKIVGEFEAGLLEKKKCLHPFLDRTSLIILGRHVTLDAGTGCVHTAPGHGREDYEVGLQYGLDVYSPVDDRGCFTQEVDFLEDKFVFKADREIIEKLAHNGSLLAEKKMAHSYPHCWRCKKPVIFRATPQWFISMENTGLRSKALKEIDHVEWIPRWGRERIYGMIENRPDWCVSRQRSWGVPITIFYCEKCETLHINQEIIDIIYDLFEKHGADIWFEKDAIDFLPKNSVCEKCGHDKFVKETDILDVWFDSGVSHVAVLEDRPYLKWPADLYLEGSDQHRGWFHSSLLTAVGTRGKAPFKSVLTHGFVVDAKGKKMSKSLGNVIAPKKVIDRYGAELLRLWVSASDYKDDIRISDNILAQLTDAYKKIRNTCRFMLGNLYDFDPEQDAAPYEAMLEIDRFALHKLQKLIEKTLKAYDSFEFHTIYHALYNFCTLDMSALYLDILKDRLYTSSPGSIERRSAQTAMHIILDTLVKLMAPILAFTSEEIWKFMPATNGKEESIHLSSLPAVNDKFIDSVLEKKWELLINLRNEVTKALEEARVGKLIGHSLDGAVTICANGALHDELVPYADDLKSIFIVSDALLTGDEQPGAYKSENIEGLSILVEQASGDKCVRCWMHDSSVGNDDGHPEICERCGQVISVLT